MTETVTISRAEYDRLIALAEDVEDAKSLADFVARLAAGEEELIPAAFADRLREGGASVDLEVAVERSLPWRHEDFYMTHSPEVFRKTLAWLDEGTAR